MFSLKDPFDLGKPVLIAATLSGCLLIWVFYVLFLSPLRSVPGPFLARFTRLWEFYHLRKGSSHKTAFRDMHDKYGPVVRVAPNRYSFSNAEDVKKIYALGGKFAKSEYYEAAGDPDRKNLFSFRDMKEHAVQRRKVSNLYSTSTLLAYEAAVDKMSEVCLEKMEQFAAAKKMIQVPDFMQCYAFDVISEITLGENFNMMRDEEDIHGTRKLLKDTLIYLGTLGLLPEVNALLCKLGKLFNNGNSGFALNKFIAELILKYKDDALKPKQAAGAEPFLAKLVSLQAASKINYNELFITCSANIGAGSDTTAISLSAALWYIYHNPTILAKLRDEIKQKRSPDNQSMTVSYHEAQKMPYLQAVIKEVLRMHPAVGTILARKVPAGGEQLGGRYFPEGTDVGASAWVLHYDPIYFGADSYTFRPERWFEEGHEQRNAMFIPFGSGSRVCIGKNISMLEMSKVIPTIVSNFDLEFEHPDKPFEEYCAWFVWTEYNCKVHSLSEKERARKNAA